MAQWRTRPEPSDPRCVLPFEGLEETEARSVFRRRHSQIAQGIAAGRHNDPDYTNATQSNVGTTCQRKPTGQKQWGYPPVKIRAAAGGSTPAVAAAARANGALAKSVLAEKLTPNTIRSPIWAYAAVIGQRVRRLTSMGSVSSGTPKDSVISLAPAVGGRGD